MRHIALAETRRKLGRCPQCGHPAVLLPGQFQCGNCKDRKRELKARWLEDPENRKHQNDYIARRKAEAVSKGICRSCLKRKARTDKRTCAYCSARAKLRKGTVSTKYF